QCLALSGNDLRNKAAMARVLIDAGAALDAPFSAACSCNNIELAELLLDAGAAIDGNGPWSPLEEALYWNSRGAVALLLRRGARIRNLRTAAGLGRTDLIESYFHTDGSLKPEAGTIEWPWGNLQMIANSNFDAAGKDTLARKYSAWPRDRVAVI